MFDISKERLEVEQCVQIIHWMDEVKNCAYALGELDETFQQERKLALILEFGLDVFVPTEILPLIQEVKAVGFIGTLQGNGIKRQICLPIEWRRHFKENPKFHAQFSTRAEFENMLVNFQKSMNILRSISCYKSDFGFSLSVELSLIARMQKTLLMELGYSESIIKRLFAMPLYPEEKESSKLTTADVNDIYESYKLLYRTLSEQKCSQKNYYTF